MTLVWGVPLVGGGRVATAELAGLAVDQCEIRDDRFTLLAPDAYRGDYLDIKLWDADGREVVSESLYTRTTRTTTSAAVLGGRRAGPQDGPLGVRRVAVARLDRHVERGEAVGIARQRHRDVDLARGRHLERARARRGRPASSAATARRSRRRGWAAGR